MTISNPENNSESNPGNNPENSTEQKIAFPRLSEVQIAELAEIGARRHLQDGEVLFEAGEERCGFFVVLSGAVKVVDGSGDAAQVVRMHEPGEFTGDVDVLGARRAIVSAMAVGATEVLHISSGDLNRLLSEQPDLGETILNAFIARRELLMESGFQGLRVIGSHDSLRAFQLCEFLARNQVPHTWIKVEIGQDVGQGWPLLKISASRRQTCRSSPMATGPFCVTRRSRSWPNRWASRARSTRAATTWS